MRVRSLRLPSSYCVAATQSEDFIAAVGRNVVLASVAERKRIASAFVLSHSCAATFSRCDKFLAVKSTLGAIAICDAHGLRKLTEFRPMVQDEGTGPLFNEDSTLVVDATWSGSIYIRRSSDLSIEKRLSFPGEMLFGLSSSSDRRTWMVAHRGKFIDEDGHREPTYLSLWRWPLTTPYRTLPFAGQEVNCAELSPCGTRIAVTIQLRDPMRIELKLLDLDSNLSTRTATPPGDYSTRLRWAPDSSMIGVVAPGAFSLYRTSTLECVESLPDAYCSDLAILPRSRLALFGTWQRGYLTDMKPPL
jgi:hypothetical protein